MSKKYNSNEDCENIVTSFLEGMLMGAAVWLCVDALLDDEDEDN